MNIIREQYGVSVVEVEGLFYTVQIDRDRGHVYSVGTDSPPNNGKYYGNINPAGIQYVGKGRARHAAMKAFRDAVLHHETINAD